jgi:hypothetical protein
LPIDFYERCADSEAERISRLQRFLAFVIVAAAILNLIDTLIPILPFREMPATISQPIWLMRLKRGSFDENRFDTGWDRAVPAAYGRTGRTGRKKIR